MKFCLIFVGLLALCGCSNTADVLSQDGNAAVARCWGGNWVNCIAKACPNGYTIVTITSDSQAAAAIVKCK